MASSAAMAAMSSNSKSDLDDGWMLSLSVECEVVDQVLTVHDVLDGGAIASWNVRFVFFVFFVFFVLTVHDGLAT